MTSVSAEPARITNRSRYRKILWFFARTIAHLAWWDIFMGRILKSRVRRTRPDRFRLLSRRFRDLAIDMGGVMIKLGQFLSSRVDVLPPEITEELAGLQDEVPPVPLDQIMTVIEGELGDLNHRFSHFDSQPVAAASLGQVYRAWLLPDDGSSASRGAKVVVKIQRPHIRDIVSTDLAALRVVSRWVMRYPPVRRRANVPALLEEFAETLWEEMDYCLEADNAEHFAEMFAHDPDIKIPAVHREHSTGCVLVLEDVSGIKITDLDGLMAANVDHAEVAQRVLDAYFYQIFQQGFFHADPHPGNLFVIPNRTEGPLRNGESRPFILAFVDFGMVGHIEELKGSNLRRVLVAITQRDARELTAAYNELGFFLPTADLERITEAQERILNQIWGRNLLELSRPDPREIQEIGTEFRDLLFDFPFQIPQDFIFLGRALGLLSGLASLLAPNINPWHLAERYGSEIIRSRETLGFGFETLLAWLRLFATLPFQAQRVFTAAESGRLRVSMVPDRALLHRLERIEKRIGRPNWSVLSAALILSGTLFYLDGETLPALIFWSTGFVFFLLMLLSRG